MSFASRTSGWSSVATAQLRDPDLPPSLRALNQSSRDHNRGSASFRGRGRGSGFAGSLWCTNSLRGKRATNWRAIARPEIDSRQKPAAVRAPILYRAFF